MIGDMAFSKEDLKARIEALPERQRGKLMERLQELAAKDIARDSQGNTSAPQAYLSAFVEADENAVLNQDEIRKFLFESLPEYMIPSEISILKKMPVMPNGKIDRKQLAGLAPQHVAKPAFVAPRNALEEVLQQVWQEVLEMEGISVHDNFFQLGGHSLLVTMLISKIREIFEVKLSLRSIFDAPTIASLAKHLTEYFDESGRVEKTSQLYLQIANLQDDEVETLLSDKKEE